MNVVMRIMRYLRSFHGKGILFSKNAKEQNIDVYTDAIRLKLLMIEDQLEDTLPLWEETW